MKKTLLAVGVALVVRTAAAGVVYEFRQTTSSDIDSVPSADFAGKAVIDGDRFRVDFLSGTAYPPGTYVISNNATRSQFWVDPSKKSYVEVDTGSVATVIGASRISIANKKVNVEELPDHPVLAGMPTNHYRLNITYDITLPFGQIPLKQSVATTIDKWTTMAFEGVVESFLGNGVVKTGNAEIDDLVEAENTKIKGFPLRETINVTTINDTPRRPGSPIPMAQTRTQTKELVITSIEAKASIPATQFMVPAGYHKADPLRDDTQKAPLHVLSMEPSGQ